MALAFSVSYKTNNGIKQQNDLFNTEDYSAITDVIYSAWGSTSCSSHIIFILAPNIFLCSHKGLFTFIVLLAPFYWAKTNTIP